MEALNFLLTRGGLSRTRTGREAGDELVELGDFLLAFGRVGFDAGADLGFGQHHVVVTTGVGDDRVVVDVGDVGADVVEEVTIVGDRDEGAFEFVEVILKPVDAVEIEVVCRFVEEHGGGVAEEGLSEEDADLLAALEFAHFALVDFRFNTEAVEEDGGV